MSLRIGIGLVVALVAIGCSRSEAAPQPEPAHAAAASSSAVHETENYKLTIEPAGPYEKGKAGQVTIVLTTKGDYHINDQYPYKFVVQDPPAEGVSYVKKTIPRADGTFEKTRAQLPVRFTAERAGSLKVGGVLSLIVCTASNCLLDKRPLEAEITVP